MQGLQAKQLEAKRIRENFQQLSNESFLEIPDRVQNIHDLQFDDGEVSVSPTIPGELGVACSKENTSYSASEFRIYVDVVAM